MGGVLHAGELGVDPRRWHPAFRTVMEGDGSVGIVWIFLFGCRGVHPVFFFLFSFYHFLDVSRGVSFEKRSARPLLRD